MYIFYFERWLRGKWIKKRGAKQETERKKLFFSFILSFIANLNMRKVWLHFFGSLTILQTHKKVISERENVWGAELPHQVGHLPHHGGKSLTLKPGFRLCF